MKSPLGVGHDPQHGYHFWLGGERAEVELSNGTTTPMNIDFVANTEIPLAPADPGKRTLVWEIAGQSGKVKLTPADREVHIPLSLPPGDHKLSLRVEQTSPVSAEGMRVLISRFGLQPGLGGIERSEQR